MPEFPQYGLAWGWYNCLSLVSHDDLPFVIWHVIHFLLLSVLQWCSTDCKFKCTLLRVTSKDLRMVHSYHVPLPTAYSIRQPAPPNSVQLTVHTVLFRISGLCKKSFLGIEFSVQPYTTSMLSFHSLSSTCLFYFYVLPYST